MGQAYSQDLRDRIITNIGSGRSCRAAAARFGVSPSTAIRLQARFEATGSVAAAPQGRPPGGGKLAPHRDFLIEQVELRPDITMPALSVLLASEQEHADVRAARTEWQCWRQPRRLVFIDETFVKTNMTALRGRSRRGQRLKAHAPFGKWQTQTFIVALRHDRITAPWVVDGAMGGRAFEAYVKTQLAPTLERGDVVICDNLNVHKNVQAAQAIAGRGTWMLFLPKYSPDLNPIEMAFAKLKAHLRKAKARTYETLWERISHVCDLFSKN